METFFFSRLRLPCHRRTFTRCFWSGQSERDIHFKWFACFSECFLHVFLCILFFPPHVMAWDGNLAQEKKRHLCEIQKRKRTGKKIWSASEETPPYLRNTGGSLSSFWCFIFRGNIWIQMNRGTQVYLATVCAGFNQSQVRFVPFFLFLCSLAISLNFTSIHCALLAWMIDEQCCCSI